ncbi:glycosyltransferase [Agrobacterium sp. 22-211-1]
MNTHKSPSLQDDVVSPNPEAASTMVDVMGKIDESRMIGSFRDDLTEGDKLTLKNFIGREFGLEQLEVLTDVADVLAAVERHEHLQMQIDLLCLDVTVARNCEGAVFARLLKQLSPKGIVCIEASDKTERIKADALSEYALDAVMVVPGFAVFVQVDGERSPSSVCYQIDLFRRRRYVKRKQQGRLAAGPKVPEVAVIVLTHQHETFIAECLRSVIMQRGDFTMRVLVIDDASTDKTIQVARSIIAENSSDRIKFEVRVNLENTGTGTNWGAALSWAQGADFVAPCFGDDFWESENRLQEHLDFLRKWPDVVMSFNSTASSFNASRRHGGTVIAEEIITGSNIVEDNPVMSLGCTFYRGEMAEVLPYKWLLKEKDSNYNWKFNIYCGQFGPIGHLNKVLTYSRKDSPATWRKSPWNVSRASAILSEVEYMNGMFDFNYRNEFENVNEFCYSILGGAVAYNDENSKKIDVIVLDDTFPTPKNGFRYLEFTSYLQEFPSSLVLSTGNATSLVDSTPHDLLIFNYQRKYPELGNRVIAKRGKFPLHLGKLIYIMFLHNTYAMLPEIEEAGVQFIFTLYPGGGFALNNPEVDRQLTRVFGSQFFQKVIVTQQVIYEYLVRKGLCPPEKIEIIYGGVMPEVGGTLLSKRRWGEEKAHLDICFMAHKYTPRGEDKGYDVFLEVAKILRQSHDDIYFHVAGGFDQHVIDVSSLGDRIKFYGPLGPDAIDGFFRDMDIILSPNISGKIYSGSTDGFPTGCCVEAAMRGTAIFATDEFDSAKACYTDDQDIVIVKYDVKHIVDRIEQYYSDPSALKSVGEKGIKTVRDVHRLEAQMVPRINLLREAILNPPPAGEALTLRRKIAGLQTELAHRDEQLAALTKKKRKLSLLLRGLRRLLTGRSDTTAKEIFRVFRSGGFKGLRRALRDIGS